MQSEETVKPSIKNKKKPLDFPLLGLGVTAKVKRPPLSVWIAAGKLPDSLLSMLARIDGVQSVEIKGEDVPAMMDFAIKLARESFIWPKVVDEADPESDDEISPADIPAGDLMRFLSWACSDCPGIPVKTASGEMSADALRSFREDGQLQGAGADGGAVRAEAERVDGNP